jgi:hypothetical protein
MTLVGLLTIDQYNQIVGQMFDEDSYFNPIQDANDDWIISTEEINFCTNPEFLWVKNLPLIEYIPKNQSSIPL